MPYGGPVSTAGGGKNAQLLQESQVIETTPSFRDPPVANAEDVDAAESHLPPRGSDAHDLATVWAPGGEVLSNQIPFRYQEVEVAVPIPEGRTEKSSG